MSADNGTWALRLLALALAVGAWFFVSVGERERRSETLVEPFVQYNTPRNLTILNPQEKVRVQVRGPTSKISNLNPFQINVVVDLRSAAPGTAEVNLGPENVVLPDGLEVVSIQPNLLPITLDRVVTEMKPVEPRLTGEPAAGAIVQNPEVFPPLVLVSGPESRLSELTALTTTPVRLTGHALDFEEQAAVVSPDPQVKVLQPAVVTVKVPMQIPNTGTPGGP